MSNKIRFQVFHVLYRIFTYPTNKSGGWNKLMYLKVLFGLLIFVSGLILPKGVQAQNQNSKLKPYFISEKNIKSDSNDIKNTIDLGEVRESSCNQSSIENDVYTIIEHMPQFPGGMDSLFIFISKNLKYPKADDFETQGKVICRFIVNKDGSLSNIVVLRSLGPSFDAEAIKVLKLLPNFIPGKQNGQIVRVYFILPITFKLE